MNRRNLLQAAVSLPLMSFARQIITAASAEAIPFDRSIVRQLARDAANKPYKAPDSKLPDNLEEPGLRSIPAAIRFLPERALWRGEKLPFEVQFFHRGFFYAPRVDIYEVANGQATKIAYRPENFSFGSNQATAARHRSGLCRISDPRADQPARLLRRGLRFSRRELFPRRRKGRNLRAVGARTGDQHRRGQGRGISALQDILDRKAGARMPPPSSCTPCSTARVRRPPIASRYGPATPRSST